MLVFPCLPFFSHSMCSHVKFCLNVYSSVSQLPLSLWVIVFHVSPLVILLFMFVYWLCPFSMFSFFLPSHMFSFLFVHSPCVSACVSCFLFYFVLSCVQCTQFEHNLNTNYSHNKRNHKPTVKLKTQGSWYYNCFNICSVCSDILKISKTCS